MEGSLDIAGLLLDNGADIDYVDTDSRSSLYMMALENDVKTGENQSELNIHSIDQSKLSISIY